MLPDNVWPHCNLHALANSLNRQTSSSSCAPHSPLPSSPFPRLAHKFHGNQPAATASHPNFICCTAAGLLMLSPLLSFSLTTSPLHFPARLHFVSFSFRESASASCAELKQAEILLPLFMLSLCNILPAAAATAAVAAAALGALVFNILQLVKALRSSSLCLLLPLSRSLFYLLLQR